MKKLGYIMQAKGYEGEAEDMKWMQDFGCRSIAIEKPEHEVLRPEWLKVKKSLRRGDVVVFPRLRNVVRSGSQALLFIESCRANGFRAIAIRDKVDTAGELFPDTKASDMIDVFANLPEDIINERGVAGAPIKRVLSIKVLSHTLRARAERTKMIVNMYRNGYLIDDIWAASGFRSRCSVYNVLRKAGVFFDRKRSRPRERKRC